MSDFTKKMQDIRKMMSNLKNEKYAIVNQFLAEQDEYVKSLYMKVLCTVVQYDNNATEMQVLLAERILKGISLEENFEDYMRKALDISDTDMQEFFLRVGSSELRYYFALDGILLVSVSEMKKTSYEYLAELIELLGVNKDDLEYICLVAKSILQQESSYYDDAKECLNERVSKVDFTPYIYNYYAGAVVDTDAMVCYSAPTKKLSKNIEYPAQFSGRTVIFENLDIVITEAWKFEGCKEIVFRNCMLIGTDYHLNVVSTEKLVFENCVIKNFTNRFAYIKDAGIIQISNCNFENCSFTKEGPIDIRGGVFYITGHCVEVAVENSKVTNCYIKSTVEKYNYGVSAVFMEFSDGVDRIKVIDNEFVNCRCINNGNYRKAIVHISRYSTKKEDQNNKFVGELTRLFED